MRSFWRPRLGAVYLGDGRCRFRVWASKRRRVELHITAPHDRVVPMEPRGKGYFEATLDGIEPGTRYLYRLDGEGERPDPASRLQPTTVHEPSAVVDPSHPWTDRAWHGIPLDKYVIYELHVGTFTPEGTFDAVIPRLPELVELGVTAIELMPVAQFAGRRGWGYDGVYPFAPQNSCGGPTGLKRLVDACHAHGVKTVAVTAEPMTDRFSSVCDETCPSTSPVTSARARDALASIHAMRIIRRRYMMMRKFAGTDNTTCR